MKTIKDIAVTVFAALFVFGFSAWSILKPDDDFSVSERRPLAQMPTLSKESISGGSFTSKFEDYSLDQFPLRDSFRRLKSITSFYVFGKLDNNGIYIKDGYASKLEYPENYDSADYAISRMRYVYEKYFAESDANVYISVIPDKNRFLAGDGSIYPSLNYENYFEYIKKSADFAEYIDITDLTDISDYYKTDTHWKQECITDIADRLVETMGQTPPIRNYETITSEIPFYGVYYGQSALPLDADKLTYLESKTLNSCKVYDYETSSYISVYDKEKLNSKDPYEVFLSGSKSLLTIRNENSTSDRKLILFRDSFGSSIAPLLVDSYAEITLIDIRYISPSVIDRFVNLDGDNTDVLFLYSTLVLNNSETFK